MNTDALLSSTTNLVDKLHYVRQDFNLVPSKDHVGMNIKFVGINELRKPFLQSLCATIVKYVYSKDQCKKIHDDFPEMDIDDISGLIYQKAKEKFRHYSKRGQFSELLIFTLLQHFFCAAPFLRKAKITTNPQVERNGADGIHIKYEAQSDTYSIYIAECKTKNNLSSGLHECISDAVLHWSELVNEMGLYVFEEFIHPQLQPIAKQFLEGKLPNLKTNIVCMVTYENEYQLTGGDDLNNEMISSIIRSCSSISHEAIKKKVPQYAVESIHYMLFPINDLEKLITEFEALI